MQLFEDKNDFFRKNRTLAIVISVNTRFDGAFSLYLVSVLSLMKLGNGEHMRFCRENARRYKARAVKEVRYGRLLHEVQDQTRNEGYGRGHH